MARKRSVCVSRQICSNVDRCSTYKTVSDIVNNFGKLLEEVPWVALILPYLVNHDKSIRTTHLFTITTFVRPQPSTNAITVN